MAKSHPWKYEILILLIFSALVFLIYANSLNGPFVFDDERSILNNPSIRLTDISLGGISKAVFQGPHAHRPIANLSFALNYFFHQYNTAGYHLVNLVIHIITGFIIFYLMRITLVLSLVPGIFKKRREKIRGHIEQPTFRAFLESPVTLIPFFAALIWLVHPLQTQSVSYVVQRMNCMAAMFFTLSMLFYIKARLAEKQITKRVLFVGCILSGIMALGSKEIAATLPFFIFLYEWYFFQDLSRAWLRRYAFVPGGMIALCILLAFVYLGAHPLDRVLSEYDSWDFTLKQRLLTQFRVVAFYISLIIFPHPSRLNLDHDFPVSLSIVDPVTTFFSFGAVLVLAGMAVQMAKKERLLSFCILWFLGNLVIESSVIALDMVFEHRIYLPSAFFFLMVTTLLFRYIKPKWFSAGVMVALVITFSVWTHERNHVWRNPIALWQDAVSKSPNKARPHHNLGLALAQKGDLHRAVQHYVRALEIDPNNAIVHNSMGNAQAARGRLKEAIYHYKKALSINPDYGTAYNNLGYAFTRLGRYKKAMDQYSKAISLNPRDEVAHDNMGFALLKLGKTREAVDQYAQVIQIKPRSAAAHNNLGHALVMDGQTEKAMYHFNEALRINPKDVLAHNNLGLALARQGRLEEAIRHYKKALEIDPVFYWAHNNWGTALEKMGRIQEAIEHYNAALRIKPGFREAAKNLARARRKAESAVKKDN